MIRCAARTPAEAEAKRAEYMNKLPPTDKTFTIEAGHSARRSPRDTSIKKSKGGPRPTLRSLEEKGQSAWLDYLQRRLRSNDKKTNPVGILEVKLMKELYEGRRHS